MDVIDLSRFPVPSTSIFPFFFASSTVGLALVISIGRTVAYVSNEHRKVFETGPTSPLT